MFLMFSLLLLTSQNQSCQQSTCWEESLVGQESSLTSTQRSWIWSSSQIKSFHWSLESHKARHSTPNYRASTNKKKPQDIYLEGKINSALGQKYFFKNLFQLIWKQQIDEFEPQSTNGYYFGPHIGVTLYMSFFVLLCPTMSNY